MRARSKIQAASFLGQAPRERAFVRGADSWLGRHSRRTDFKNFKGNDFTPLAAYAMSVDKVREKLTLKLKNQSRWNKARDRPYLEQFSVPPSEYKVLVATDEPRDSPFRHEIDRMGWVVINHVSWS